MCARLEKGRSNDARKRGGPCHYDEIQILGFCAFTVDTRPSNHTEKTTARRVSHMSFQRYLEVVLSHVTATPKELELYRADVRTDEMLNRASNVCTLI